MTHDRSFRFGARDTTVLCRIALLARASAALAATLAFPSRVATAQGMITVAAGSPSTFQVVPGGKLVVPIVADMSAAGGGRMAALSASLTWDVGVLTLDSIRTAELGVVQSNLTNATAGTATFSVLGERETSATETVANAYFTAASTAGGTRLMVFPSQVTNAAGIIRLSQVVPRHAEVCVAPPGLWGDTNGDGSVDIIDAQQIARSVIGLSMANAAAVASLGDVNADGAVDIIDAQQISRYSVSLPAPPRVNTSVANTPVVASLPMTLFGTFMAVGRTVTVLATPKDAAGNSLVGCAPTSFTSSDPSKLLVNSGGGMVGMGIGPATITATAGTVTSQLAVSVTGPDTTSALLHLRNLTAAGPATFAGSSWMLGGLLTDEWKSSDTFPQRDEIDQRNIPDGDALVQNMLRELYLMRSDAGYAGRTLLPAGRTKMTLLVGYAELLMAEMVCSGVVFDDASSGLAVSGAPVSSATLYAQALSRFDSIVFSASAPQDVDFAARVARARALLGMGQAGAAGGSVFGVPTNFQYLVAPVSPEVNSIWQFNNSQRRLAVGDSVDPSGLIGNAVPFASAADARVPVFGTSLGASPAGRGFDGRTNLVVQNIWPQTGAVPLVSGIDARLIEAEARLVAGDLVGMTAILNALRAAPQNLGGAYTTPAMPPLAVPTAAATQFFFREKAFWTFGRGQRLGDLRRMVRLYGLAESAVFPTGTFHKGGTYGTTINFPASIDEQGNALTTVCTDRNP